MDLARGTGGDVSGPADHVTTRSATQWHRSAGSVKTGVFPPGQGFPLCAATDVRRLERRGCGECRRHLPVASDPLDQRLPAEEPDRRRALVEVGVDVLLGVV